MQRITMLYHVLPVPYAVFKLEYDNAVFDKSHGKQKPSIKQDEQNPEYDETFVFDNIPWQLKTLDEVE